ncbi:MAG: hypothetical protein BMS9Abin33_1295 [Gammaproteobacteria bacterium]|nr:MAG: hypothetical protein BMS9Abin33_1295 [Gammaproteobacteria bacterium]
MNLPKKTVFWVIALVGLTGGFYLIDEQVEDVNKASQASLRLFSFEPEDLQAFWIKSRTDGLRARLVKEDKTWWLKKPVQAKADGPFIEKFLSNIVKARKDAVLFENPQPAKLEELGLATAELEMGFETSAGTTVIQFGHKGPTHNIAYARFQGDPRVYRIHSDVKEEADKHIYDLRDKTILDFDPLKLSRFDMQRKNRDNIVIVHDKGRWNMIQPYSTRAAMSKVLETLYKIRNSQVKAFISEKPADLKPYGLDTPGIKLTILEHEKNNVQQLLVGAKDRNRRGYFAKADASDEVFLIEEALVNSLLVDANEWKE